MYNRSVPRLLRALVFIAVVTRCITANANGRFPEAQTFESVPGSDGKTIFLRTTFGVLVSRDRGQRWRWICERSLGYDGQWDPPIAVTRDGRLWVGLEGGLLSTTTDGCEVERTPELEGHTVKDLTTDPRGETLWAITGAPGKRSFVWRRDPGKAFERLAGMDDTNLMTIEVAPSRPGLVYVTGQPYTTIRGQIFRSDDRGATFANESAAALVADGPLFIGSVDPLDPQRILLRHLHAKGSDLYLSKDGGRTLTNVLTMASAMFGFTKTADGKSIWAGSGLAEHGIFRSTDRGEHFDVVSKHGVLCLHAAASDALFVCENAFTPGAPAIGLARDGVGRTITPIAKFTDIDGPVACEGGDARASLCAGSWPEMQAVLSPSPSPSVSPAASAMPDAGPSPAAPPRRSCGCDAVGASNGGSEAWLVVAVALGVVVVRLDRRSSKRRALLNPDLSGGAPMDQQPRTRVVDLSQSA
jgi:hypothetical protein